MELEESIKHIEDIIDWHWKNSPDRCYVMGNKDFDAFTTIINYIKEESIPRVVVEEKIRELENQEPVDDDYAFEIQNDIHSKINVLQEILNKGE